MARRRSAFTPDEFVDIVCDAARGARSGNAPPESARDAGSSKLLTLGLLAAELPTQLDAGASNILQHRLDRSAISQNLNVDLRFDDLLDYVARAPLYLLVDPSNIDAYHPIGDQNDPIEEGDRDQHT